MYTSHYHNKYIELKLPSALDASPPSAISLKL